MMSFLFTYNTIPLISISFTRYGTHINCSIIFFFKFFLSRYIQLRLYYLYKWLYFDIIFRILLIKVHTYKYLISWPCIQSYTIPLFRNMRFILDEIVHIFLNMKTQIFFNLWNLNYVVMFDGFFPQLSSNLIIYLTPLISLLLISRFVLNKTFQKNTSKFPNS